jgi:peptide/nickel transport system permease protein
VTSRDMPLLQTCAMIFCAAYLSLVLLADICAILANPRLRRQ